MNALPRGPVIVCKCFAQCSHLVSTLSSPTVGSSQHLWCSSFGQWEDGRGMCRRSMHADLEPARLASVADRYRASVESHAWLCGRLASCCNAAVKRETRAAAASQPSVHTVTWPRCSRHPARSLHVCPAALQRRGRGCQAA